MADYRIISDVSNYLLYLLRGAVCPELLPHQEQVALNRPGQQDNEATLCAYLYSIKDFSVYVPEWESGNAPMAFSLGYVIFLSQQAQTPLDPLIGAQVLGRAMQIIYEHPVLDIAKIHQAACAWDEPASLSFQKLDEYQKQELWGGFQQPVCPAIYLDAGPFLLNAGGRPAKRTTKVQEETKWR